MMLVKPKTWILLAVCICLLGIFRGAKAARKIPPAVAYDVGSNTITVGSPAGAAAGSEPVTIPDLAVALAGLGEAGRLVEQSSGVWLLKSHLIIDTTARLEATAVTISALRLDSSTPGSEVIVTAQLGGHLLIDGVTVTSWDTGAGTVDTNFVNGRSYLLATNGARMDILNADVGYLGDGPGRPSGVSWRERIDPADETTGATGRLEDSLIHHNFFGMYTYEAYEITILRNEVYDNDQYGIDPHDFSYNFEVAYNDVHDNGKHGIIFSRQCENNNIHHNESYNNVGHGIMLDRGTNNNTVTDNLVYGNHDGIVIYQSSDNLVQNNTIIDNDSGIRISSTYLASDRFDDIATNNEIRDNLIQDSHKHGIYIYNRSDRNLVFDNVIEDSTDHGMYIRTGGNQIRGNSISGGIGDGIGILIRRGDPESYPPEATPALELPAHNNVVTGNMIWDNLGPGVEVEGGVSNQIGQSQQDPLPADSNQIEMNGLGGVLIQRKSSGEAATDNWVIGNLIQANGGVGITIQHQSSVRNLMSRNNISNNAGLGIEIMNSANDGVLPPAITAVSLTNQISGTAISNAHIEIYLDPAGEGAQFLGSSTADGGGNWAYDLPVGADPGQATVLATDADGNSSAFSTPFETAVYTVGNDGTGQTTIFVTGLIPAPVVTLQTIQNGLGANAGLLENQGNGVWQLNANLVIEAGVTLNLTAANGLTELKLRSEAASFVYLQTLNGIINVDGIKIYAWDGIDGDYDEDLGNGRSYILAAFDAQLNIVDAELSYLGSANSQSHGVTWWDDANARVTGQVSNSQFHHNYAGIVAQQANNLTVSGSQFHNNVSHGLQLLASNNSSIENNSIYQNLNGVALEAGSSGNDVANNQIYGNDEIGIRVDGVDTLTNGWSQNAIYDNQLGGISLLNGANNGIQPPEILHVWAVGVSGTAVPNATIEIFSDTGSQGRYFQGSTLADSNGQFSFSIPTFWQAEGVTAVATDSSGNSSAFAPSQTITIYKIFVPVINQN